MNTSQRIWNPGPMHMKVVTRETNVFVNFIKPESDLENLIINDSEWQEGAIWGEPRSGHPEGKIIYHIHEVLENVDKATNSWKLRQQLRLVTILHDTFKHLEETARPRTDWSKHHAIFAVNFAKKYVKDQAVLDVITAHDDAFYAWRASYAGQHEKSAQLLDTLREKMGKNMQLFYLFFKCDTQTGDKYQSPVHWFEQVMQDEISLTNF